MSDILDRAEDFVWRNARLLDRHLFSYLFLDGSREPVLESLRAYQNGDGGFVNGLEPDMGCPRQPASELRVRFEDIGLNPTPQSFCRRLFDDDVIEAHLSALISQQAQDGGWSINWETVSPLCGIEWRGWTTLEVLMTLKTYGRI